MDRNVIKRYLKSYKSIQECIEIAESEIIRLNSLKTQEQTKLGGISDGMPRAPGVSDVTYSNCQRAIELYDASIASQQRLKAEAEERIRIIETLIGLSGTFKARDVLYKHYCENKTWDEVANEMHYTSRHIKRVGYAALDVIAAKCHFHVTFSK